MHTEDKIKRIAASFLKSYYKFRPRVGATDVRFDQSSGDIIADGHLTFMQEDGKVFLATFEATSQESADEVTFQLRKNILFWDGFVFSSTLSFIIMTLLWYFKWITIADFGLERNLLLFLGIWLVILAFYGMLFIRSSRYRYIYAISQFSSYFADDQWVVIDEQIFKHSQNLALLELKRQCTKSGFGLIAINKSEEPRVLIAAARQDEFGSQRKNIAFGDQQLSFREKAKVQIFKPFQFVKSKLKPISWKKNIMRFQGEHRSQTGFGILCIIATLGLFGMQYYESKYHFEDEYAYEQRLLNSPSEQEIHVVLVEDEAIRKFQSQENNYLQISNDDIKALDPYKGEADILMHSSPHHFTYYPCERLHHLDGDKYLLQLGLFSNFSSAKEAVLNLTTLEIASNIIWSKCFDDTKNGYILTFEEFFRDEAVAKKKGVELMKKYKGQKLFKRMRLIELN